MIAWALGFKHGRHGTQGPPKRHPFSGSPESEVQTGSSQAGSKPPKQKISCPPLKSEISHKKIQIACFLGKKIRYGDTGPVFKPAWLWSAGADLLLHPAAGVWTLQVTVVPIPLCCLINVSYLAPSNIWICHCCFKWRKGNLILGPKRLGRALCMTFLQFRSHLITSKYTPRDTSCLWSSWASFPTRLWAPWGKGSQLPFHCYIPSALHSA